MRAAGLSSGGGGQRDCHQQGKDEGFVLSGLSYGITGRGELSIPVW